MASVTPAPRAEVRHERAAGQDRQGKQLEASRAAIPKTAKSGAVTVAAGTAEYTALLFFFSSRRRHTRFDCDWSSDVCSSDLGGEGGGVLADWIVDLAQHGGYLAQATSVPGVAQRTGATIYYVELFPKAAAQAAGREPVLALMPMPGDVDVVLASELMEAARAVERGFVTPDRTLLVASTHRVFAMTEKIALADGRSDAATLLAACREAARELLAFDMEALAEATGSVLSAVLFGALAGSGALPFPRTAFEAAIRRGQVGVERSLAAFAAGFEAARAGDAPVPAPASMDHSARAAPTAIRELLDRAAHDFSSEARRWCLPGSGGSPTIRTGATR